MYGAVPVSAEDRAPTAYPGPRFLAVGGSTMGYCHLRCGAWIRGRWLGAIGDKTDVVDGAAFGHACVQPQRGEEPPRRYLPETHAAARSPRRGSQR